MMESSSDEQDYYELNPVKRENIKLERQPDVDPKHIQADIELNDFKKWLTQHDSGVTFQNGLYAFIIISNDPDRMKLVKVGDEHQFRLLAVGHSSLVTKTQYQQLKTGVLHIIYAGELMIVNNELEWWSDKSGHFPAYDDEQDNKEIFAKHWGLDDTGHYIFKSYEERQQEIDARKIALTFAENVKNDALQQPVTERENWIKKQFEDKAEEYHYQGDYEELIKQWFDKLIKGGFITRALQNDNKPENQANIDYINTYHDSTDDVYKFNKYFDDKVFYNYRNNNNLGYNNVYPQIIDNYDVDIILYKYLILCTMGTVLFCLILCLCVFIMFIIGLYFGKKIKKSLPQHQRQQIYNV